jgi:Uma2 family endonuclease
VVEVRFGYKTVDLPYTLRVHGVTEEMFEELVDEDTKAELLDGVMIVHSPATLEHDDIGGFVRTLMRWYAEARKAGRVLGPDTLVHLASCRKFAPDALFVRKNRIPKPRPREFEGSPDSILEVLSPSTRDDDLEDKRPAYREAGVKEIWFVDPENEQVIVDRLRGFSYVEKICRRGKLRSTVLKGFWINVRWLWSDPMPAVGDCLREIMGGK